MIVDAHTHVFRHLHGRIAAGDVTSTGWGRARLGEKEIQLLPPFVRKRPFHRKRSLPR